MAMQRNPKFYIYKGGPNIPRHVTHLRVHKFIKVIQEWQFFRFDKLEYIELHDGIEAIGGNAFNNCTSLKHVRALGVKVVESCTFFGCKALTDVEFGDKLERIKKHAFKCSSVRHIILPLDVHFDYEAFAYCPKIEHLGLTERTYETINALQLREWRDDVLKEINAIIQDLNPKIQTLLHEGEILYFKPIFGAYGFTKDERIRNWRKSVSRKVNQYRAKSTLLKEVTTTLELALWKMRLGMENSDVTEADLKRRAECRISNGAHSIIPNVMSFLSIE